MIFSAVTKLLREKYPNEEEQRVANILFLITSALWGTYLVVMATAIYWKDGMLIVNCALGCIGLLVPLALLLRGHVHTSGLILILGVLLSATIIATNGQGMYDTGTMAFPVIVIIASLILRRRDFFICSFFTLLAVGWLVFGEMAGVFRPKPFEPAGWRDLLVMTSILGVAVLAADLLSSHMRKNLQQAKLEISQRKILEEQLRYQSMHDALTGIFNRAFFEGEMARLNLSREFPVSIIIADVNELKHLNDTQGHAAGDELLRQAALVLGGVFRASDVLARIGGDEFAVLLARTDAVTAGQMLERIHMKIQEYNRRHPDLPLQIALGTATAEPGRLPEAFVAADQRMYAEKALQKLKT